MLNFFLRLTNKHPILNEFMRFAVVGVINTSCNYVLFLFLLKIVGVYYLVSGACGFALGAVTAFFLNRLWTFKSDVDVKKGLGLYLLIQLFCLSIHLFIQFLATESLHVPEEFSQACGIVIVMFINFSLIRKIVFRNAA